MTPRDARKAGASWGLSEARAEYGKRMATATNYAMRREEEAHRLPEELRPAFYEARDAAYDAEWARLEGGQG